MRTSVGLRLLVASAAVFVTAVCLPTSTPAVSNPHHAEIVTASPRVDLAAAVRTLAAVPPNPVHVAAATAAIDRIDPAAGRAAAARRPALRAAVSAALAAPQNSASNVIDSIYQSARGAVTYGVQLASYALQFVPYGYLISDQINIFYYNLGLPIADSIVYGLIDPVVNDPLNPAAYVNGIVNVGRTSINAAINTGIAEFNNFFGWLIPPLPPVARVAAGPLAAVGMEGGPVGSGTSAAEGATTLKSTTTTEGATGSDGATGSASAAGSASVAGSAGATATDVGPAATPPETLGTPKAPKTHETSGVSKALKSSAPADATDSTDASTSTNATGSTKAVDSTNSADSTTGGGHTSAPTAAKSDDSDSGSHSDVKTSHGKKSREHGARKGSVNGSTGDEPARAKAAASKH